MDYSEFIEVLACISVASFHFASGVVLGFSAILIPQLESPDSEIKVTKQDISWIGSVVPLVVPVSSILTGYLVDRMGRLNTIRVAIIPYVIGWLCIAMADNFTMIIIGRVLTGFSTGLGCNPAIVYITEVARSALRAALISLAVSLASTGLIVVYAKGAFLGWRTICWISIAYCVPPFLFMYLWSPESPVWLVSRGKNEGALKSLSYFHRRDKKAGLADQQLEELLKEHNKKENLARKNGSAFGKLLREFCKPTGYKPMVLLTMIFFFQQSSGIYITLFYAVTLLQSIGTSVDPNISSIALGVVRLIAGFLTLILLKTFGRRPLFMVSCIGMAIFIFASGYYTKEIAEGNKEKNIIPIVYIFMYMSAASFGFMSIPWTMTAELFPIEIRGMAQSVIMAVANIIMFIVLKIYPFLDEMLGGAYAVQWMFAAACAVSTVFVFLFLPETHKKELAEIQEYFANNTVYILQKKKTTQEITEDAGQEMINLKSSVQ